MQLAQQEAMIRERAYAIWESEGRPDGREWDHWERASREVVHIPAAPAARPAARRKTAGAKGAAKGRMRSALKSVVA
ncbi:MAG TPA: DUF2934 domain-containing protein [Propylenella sp.]